LITIQEYYESLLGEARLIAESDGSSVEVNFIRQMLDRLVDCGEINSYELNEDGDESSGLWKLDAYSVDNDSEASTGSITLFISNVDQADTLSNLNKSELDSLLKKVKKFVDFSLEKNIYEFFEVGSNSFEAATEIKNNWDEKATNFRIYIISNKQLSSRVKDLTNIEIHDVKFDIFIWDLSRFFQLELSGREREPLEIDLSSSPIKALVATIDETDISSFLAVIPATTLVDIYSKWGSRLLEQNVRSFLTAKVKVNKGIRETIKNSPSKFFAFNNGITATAESVTLEKTDDGEYITAIENFQIVNGGQTTASLYSAFKKDKYDISKIFVQMKLSIVSPQKAAELVPYIARFANSQNKVTEADLFSNHPFHVRFEEYSRKIEAPQKQAAFSRTYWFYERARGQYTNAQGACKTALEKTKFLGSNPRNQLINKTSLAKFLNSFNLVPHVVSKGSEYNFAKYADQIAGIWENSDSLINENFYKTSIAKAIIFKSIERLVGEQKDSWYKGHRDKIIPYTISFVEYVIQKHGKEFNFDEIWKKQDTSEKLNAFLLIVAEKISSVLHDDARTMGNVGEYAKREACWSATKKSADEFDITNYLNLFLDRKMIEITEMKSSAVQKALSEKDMISMVHQLEPKKLEDLREYLRDNSLLNEFNIDLIKQAIYKRKPLSEEKCKILYGLWTDYTSHYHDS
jgi:hypothetical protein